MKTYYFPSSKIATYIAGKLSGQQHRVIQTGPLIETDAPDYIVADCNKLALNHFPLSTIEKPAFEEVQNLLAQGFEVSATILQRTANGIERYRGIVSQCFVSLAGVQCISLENSALSSPFQAVESIKYR